MTQTPSLPKAGYLKSCMDWRFVAETRRVFEKLTGLGGAEYYHEACAGGALNNPYPDFPNFPTNSPPTPNGADFVYGLNGEKIDLRFMGWQVHVEHCGGLPELHNDEIVVAFKKLIDAGYFQNKYPNVKNHVYLVFPYPTLFDLNGNWTDPWTPGQFITVTFPSISITRSVVNRADAYGSIVNCSTLSVTFPPDDAPLTGTLQAPNLIQWSNGTTWTKL